ncbi:MAG: hypothetical protein WCY30_01655 [Candidatus Neomarinimicrobiota bacterium]|jgi:hypothetical protein
MQIIKSENFGVIVICDSADEYSQASKKADELEACLYTRREIEFLKSDLKNYTKEERDKMLKMITDAKKIFLGFLIIPNDWNAK